LLYLKLVGFIAVGDLSGAYVTRLEFRPYAAVKQLTDLLPLPDYLAANLLQRHLHLPDYLAAHATASSVSRQFLLPDAARAATVGHIFSGRFPLLRAGWQQRAVIKVFLLDCRYQQDFLLTPSESNSLSTFEPAEINSSPEQVIDIASAREVQ
jgi:hypothetical protein